MERIEDDRIIYEVLCDYCDKEYTNRDDKEMLYSHQNIIGAINALLPYLTNNDLDEMMLRFHTLKDHRRQKEYQAHLEAKEKSIQKNRHDTP